MNSIRFKPIRIIILDTLFSFYLDLNLPRSLHSHPNQNHSQIAHQF